MQASQETTDAWAKQKHPRSSSEAVLIRFRRLKTTLESKRNRFIQLEQIKNRNQKREDTY
ncbi:hypothetical protein MJO28_015340 [Puccinia striiformis f. sp. tritici]|uniref:Uncharacterized protein n=1 Tax=Puccinia striiformis f. sp. tritici TaxID=168172 RepID=A0ACC0DS88_9BASI|nr:hypothetical protein MJO28_015340 [Puccinia striiformis f. sp. tritici]